jgi:hypothetical protein
MVSKVGVVWKDGESRLSPLLDGAGLPVLVWEDDGTDWARLDEADEVDEADWVRDDSRDILHREAAKLSQLATRPDGSR